MMDCRERKFETEFFWVVSVMCLSIKGLFPMEKHNGIELNGTEEL